MVSGLGVSAATMASALATLLPALCAVDADSLRAAALVALRALLDAKVYSFARDDAS
jgi:hypothetical protein